jgi:hypothetical protein
MSLKFQIPVEINSKKLLIKPYTSKIEKDILIMSTFEVFDVKEVLRILELDENVINSLSENEMKVLLYKYRESSLGDEIQIKFKCKECNKQNESSIIASNFITFSELNDSDILKIDKEVTENNVKDFLLNNVDIEDLDIDEYENLIIRVKKNQNKFDFVKECKCTFCRTSNFFNIGSPKYIIEQLSDHTLMTLYKTYNNMMIFGNLTKTDIDNMYPFERTIFIGLITKTKEDIAK